MADPIDLSQLALHFSDEDRAREFVEALRWPNGPFCPHCGALEVYRLTPKPTSKHPGRKGLLKCKYCRKQFTVKVGTVFEDSHIELRKWLLAIHLLCSSKKGMSAHQIHRMLGVTIKTAWFMMHRIRYAMTAESFEMKLDGTVEMDETYIGGKFKNMSNKKRKEMRATGAQLGVKGQKAPVVSLVQRDGNVRSFHVPQVTGANLKKIIQENVDPSANLMSDGASPYFLVERDFASYESVDHSKQEYVRGQAHINSVEGYFSLLKRGIIGVYHHVSVEHLHRYTTEFDFRWNRRKDKDYERTIDAIRMAEGKRLTYNQTKGEH